VADNGSGMPKEIQRSVFEAFFTTKGLTGSGLGMWVSEEIVRAHHGAISFRSSTGPERHGTVFNVFLPDASQRTAEPKTA
jgi:signal transduction histidine kinase